MSPQSKSELAYAWIRDRIVNHEFAGGYKLVLATIATTLDMSVVPVREAVRRLEAEGLVEYEKNVGARVALADEREYVHSMQTLGVVEGVATSLSAPFLSAEQITEAREINRRLEDLLDDFDPFRFTQVNQDFHKVLFLPCPNPQILDLVDRGWSKLAAIRSSTFTFVPFRAHESVREHEEILTLIERGADPIDIEQAARQHRWRTMNAYLAMRHAWTPTGEGTNEHRKEPTPLGIK
ncbi:GntR family transcriptional regulator [Micrococcales bacterium 31B]|nr:GntR family transcriptional regulator [Micrococcales bacterium 31B]